MLLLTFASPARAHPLPKVASPRTGVTPLGFLPRTAPQKINWTLPDGFLPTSGPVYTWQALPPPASALPCLTEACESG